MTRERIDWENLQTLPRRNRLDGASREDLAARRFNLQKAKHKGRCHLSNQKRRQISKAQAEVQAQKNAAKDTRYRTFKDQVRAFWTGALDEHP